MNVKHTFNCFWSSLLWRSSAYFCFMYFIASCQRFNILSQKERNWIRTKITFYKDFWETGRHVFEICTYVEAYFMHAHTFISLLHETWRWFQRCLYDLCCHNDVHMVTYFQIFNAVLLSSALHRAASEIISKDKQMRGREEEERCQECCTKATLPSLCICCETIQLSSSFEKSLAFVHAILHFYDSKGHCHKSTDLQPSAWSRSEDIT